MQKDNVQEEEIRREVEVPNITGLSIAEAKKELESVGLNISYEDTEEEISDKIVTRQVPVAGIEIYEGTNVSVEY